MILGTMMVNIGVSPVTNTKLSITPTRIPAAQEGLGHAGDTYSMSVNIDNVADLWAVGFTIKFAPYVSVLVISELNEGTFMSQNGWLTFFYTSVSSFDGTAGVTLLRLPMGGDRIGASGDGILMTFKMTVVEAGESPIEIIDDVLLDSDGSPIAHQSTGSYYYGATASLIRATVLPGRKVRVGETLNLESKVRNDGDTPLFVRVRHDISRIEDARAIRLYAGQSYYGGGLGEPLPYEYVYVDEFDEWYYEFDNPPENLFGEPDGSYIESDINAAWASMYSFEDIELGGMPIADIFLEGYCQYPNGATENVDIDMYDVSPGQGIPFAWWGSLYGLPDWGWVSPRWTTDSVLTSSPWLADKDAFNDVWILVYNYHGSATDIMRIDSLRLRVEYSTIVPVSSPIFVVNPGEELVLDPVVWLAESEHVGSYEMTTTIEYTDVEFKWNSWASQQKTAAFSIVEG